MYHLEELTSRRLTRQQYVGVLGQEFHLSLNAPRNLRLAADQLDGTMPDLAAWLRHHADDEDGHHEWAREDLADLDHQPPDPSQATTRLLRRVREVASGDQAYLILGLSYVVEHTAPQINPDQVLPTDIGTAHRFVVRHTKVDVKHAQEVDEAIASLSPAHQAEVREQAAEFAQLFGAFLVAAAFGDEAMDEPLLVAAGGVDE